MSESDESWLLEEQTLTFLHADSPPLGDKRLSLWVSMWPQQGGVEGSETTYQDFKVGILNEDRRRRNTNLGQEWKQLGRDKSLAWSFFFYFFIYIINTQGNIFIVNKLFVVFILLVLFTLQSTHWMNQVDFPNIKTQKETLHDIPTCVWNIQNSIVFTLWCWLQN